MSETPAETIRRAATLLRERAEAASKGPWKSWLEGRDRRSGASAISTPDFDGGDIYVTVGENCHPKWEADQDFIASMHPGVGLAVADWLESRAADAKGAYQSFSGEWHFGPCDDPPGIEDAIKIARAYLGEVEA
jgi:hypothetical protein